MKLRRLCPCVGILVLLSCIVGCSGTPHTPLMDAGHEAERLEDTSVDEIVDAEGEPDAAVSSDTGDSGDAFEQAVLIPDDYICANGASSTFYPGVSAPFAKPNLQGGGPRTRAVLLQGFGGSFPERGAFFSADASLKPGSGSPLALFAQRGEDILLHYAFVTNREELKGVLLNLTVMVDYEPVEATYTIWNDERTRVLHREEATGFMEPVTRDAVLVDIRIPPDAFPEDRRYEISLFHKGTKGLITGFFRVAAYYNSFEGAEHPCMSPVIPSGARTAFEEEFYRLAAPAKMLVYPVGTTDPMVLARPVEVAPGEEIEMQLTWMPGLSDRPRVNEAWVPLLDGVPVGEPWFLSRPSVSHVVPYRATMVVTAPQEPGLHYFFVSQFDDPFIPPADHHGERVDGISPAGGWSGSSGVTLRVVE